MNRIIKFRGKSKDTGGWVYGDLTRSYTNSYICWIEKTRLFSRMAMPGSIGQFTGLQDIEGNDIYDGDIVSTNYKLSIDDLAQIVFENGCFGILWIGVEEYEDDSFFVPFWSREENCYQFIDNMIVIGNKIDNPKLLEKHE